MVLAVDLHFLLSFLSQCRRPQLEALHVLEMDRERRAEFVLKNPRVLQVRLLLAAPLAKQLGTVHVGSCFGVWLPMPIVRALIVLSSQRIPAPTAACRRWTWMRACCPHLSTCRCEWPFSLAGMPVGVSCACRFCLPATPECEQGGRKLGFSGSWFCSTLQSPSQALPR